MRNKLVSIVMPSYNSADYIIESIKSVQNQTYVNWELIIVDDCSTDDTIKVVIEYLKSINDQRISLITLSLNKGAANARNIALAKSNGQYIAFLDSDDIWLPEKLEEQIDFMETGDLLFTYTRYYVKYENQNELSKIVSGPKVISRFLMYLYCWPGCLTVIYNKDKLGVIQINNVRKHNDYLMWLILINKSQCILLDKSLSVYRKHKGSLSNVNVLKLIKAHFELYKEGLNLSFVQSFLLTINNMFFGVIKKILYERRYYNEHKSNNDRSEKNKDLYR